MKKLFLCGFIVTLFAASASAQIVGDGIRRDRVERGFENRELTRPEKFRFERDRYTYHSERGRAFEQGRINPRERRRLNHIRRHERREMFRFRHNDRRRVI